MEAQEYQKGDAYRVARIGKNPFELLGKTSPEYWERKRWGGCGIAESQAGRWNEWGGPRGRKAGKEGCVEEKERLQKHA